jgi:DNA-binding transcriptional LysR family regulator
MSGRRRQPWTGNSALALANAVRAARSGVAILSRGWAGYSGGGWGLLAPDRPVRSYSIS